MMTADEIIDLLTLAAGYDRRTVGESDVEAWGAMAAKCGWTFPIARRAIVEHFEHSDRPIMPANINTIIDSVRRRIRAQFSEDVNPPRRLRDDPVAEIAWRRKFAEEYTQRALDSWATDGVIPPLEQPKELEERERPALAAAVRSLAARRVVPRAPRPARRVPDRSAERSARVAAARAELERIDQAEVQTKAAESMRRSQRDAS